MKPQNTFYAKHGKRLIDLLLAFTGFLLASPLIGIIAILVRLQLGDPILFKQVRPGLHGNPFIIYKFRTMTDGKDKFDNFLPNNERLIPFGRMLRSTSMDELPEIINVMNGEMSLVGPRPLRIEYLPLYSKEQFARHDVKPGITGWAQIKGRNSITWEEKFKLDVWYVQNRSFFLDLKILFLTIKKVFRREGINQSKEQAMKPFKGVKLNG
ncbi:MAG: sugar transferase [Deltaproteobacteria bacterium]|nr:sugar transferase [Deltaproteobacteria bacterium]